MTDEFIKTYIDYQFERHVIPVEGRPILMSISLHYFLAKFLGGFNPPP